MSGFTSRGRMPAPTTGKVRAAFGKAALTSLIVGTLLGGVNGSFHPFNLRNVALNYLIPLAVALVSRLY